MPTPRGFTREFTTKDVFLIVEERFQKDEPNPILVTRASTETLEDAITKAKAGMEWEYPELFIIQAKAVVEDYTFAGMKSKPYPEPPLVTEPENPEITS